MCAGGMSSVGHGVVRQQRGVAAEQQPIKVEIVAAVVNLQQHVVVVAQQRDQSALPPQSRSAAGSCRGSRARGRRNRPT